jgi:hypothetical protein
MNRATRGVLRKLGTDQHLDQERQQLLQREMEGRHARAEAAAADGLGLDQVPSELLSESEKRHDKYRRQQAMAGRFTPAAERLPIMTAEERQSRDRDRPKWSQTEFEGPIGKLIEKYGDLAEVKRHLTLGQAMKYEFTEDGRVLDRDGNVIFDGVKVLSPF